MLFWEITLRNDTKVRRVAERPDRLRAPRRTARGKAAHGPVVSG